MDNQVKVRGHRIELGEVEAVLLECAGVRQAVVVLRGEGEFARLVGYVVGECPSEGVLRERLPAVMVPSVWVVLDGLPLTPNGKVDRAALPEPPPVDGPRPAPEVPATDTLTEQVRTIWQDVLQVDRVGLDDDLFDLGGDSLAAARIVARMQQRLGVVVPLEVCFDTPTIADVLAAVAADGAGVGAPA